MAKRGCVAMNEILTPEELLRELTPADPDSVSYVGDGLYEAKWGDYSMAEEDIEYIRKNLSDRVEIAGEAYQPSGYPPRWTAVKFRIKRPQ